MALLGRGKPLLPVYDHQILSPGKSPNCVLESVAEFTKRPLLAITAADLGHEPTQLEKSLLTFFRDANNWGAIVLLDEADIYLERRSTQDLSRNSIVSSKLPVKYRKCVHIIDPNDFQSSSAPLTTSTASYF
jgi:hypothetical protein